MIHVNGRTETLNACLSFKARFLSLKLYKNSRPVPDMYFSLMYFTLSGAGSFDFIVSWLVFLHISDKKSLFERCFHSLKPGGKM